MLVTGANGHIGRALIPRLREAGAVVAVVRSDRARSALGATDADVRVVDYADADALAAAAVGCTHAVHLVGIIKESAVSRYRDAHEAAAEALAPALEAAGVERLVTLSIVGADEGSTNACLASRGRTERILLAAATPVTVLRVPMVLGQGDYATAALGRRARSALAFTFRAASREQPIFAADVVAAIAAALDRAGPGEVLELAGPESLTRRALYERAAAVLGRRTRVISLPLALGMALAAVFERVSANPPVTRAMLGVLDHDDVVDAAEGAAALGISLTALDAALRAVLAPGSAA